MNLPAKLSISLLLLLQSSFAREIFIDRSANGLAYLTLSEQYCKTNGSDKTLCQEKKLRYIDPDDSDLPSFMKDLSAYIKPQLQHYRAEKLKEDVLSLVKDFKGDIQGEWYNHTEIDLFSKTPATYTLSVTSSSYTGGAHGAYGIAYENFDIKSQKKIGLEQLFLPHTEEKLLKIAEQHYRHASALKPYETLADDGWFENSFKLADQFALTSRGLNFLYNQYEIKSYADGITTFLLPYYKIRELIDPKGPLAFALSQPKETHATFDNEHMTIRLQAQKNQDGTVSVTASMTAKTSALHGWLSISLPQIHSKKVLTQTYRNRFDRLISYGLHNKIYDAKLHKSKQADYLLIEADKKPWQYSKTYTTRFRFIPHRHLKELIIDLRGMLKTQNGTYALPDEYEGIYGQQHFKNYRVFLEL